MGDFFKGWQRKVGLLTLLLACVFMGGWVRSKSTFDGVLLCASSTEYTIHSMDGGIWIARNADVPDSDSPIDWHSADMKTWDGYRIDASGKRMPFVPSDYVDTDWIWKWAGFEFCGGKSRYSPNSPTECGAIPYWSITVSMTLISFWLLLSKPRKSIQKKITEPIAAEGK